MNKIRIGLKALVAIAVISAILFAAPTIGRFVPTHKIVEPVYCGSCHPEEAKELADTTHLAEFTNRVHDTAVARGYAISDAESISGACTMCHNFWENMKWFGVNNLALVEAELDNPDAVTDIYGNDVSPYGLASTRSYILKIKQNITEDADSQGVIAWQAGIDTYNYNDSVRRTRVDYVWSLLSALSPGPVAFEILDEEGASVTTCGTAEKGLCHIAEQAVGMSANHEKLEFPDQYNVGDPYDGDSSTLGAPGGTGTAGAGVFFTHEMAYTTAQYAAKPVKLCGACHVFKLPPMLWGGEPYNGVTDNSVDNPFYGEDEFADNNIPAYDMSGDISFGAKKSGMPFGTDVYDVNYRTPDWAHQMVPCMRCHVHAGINGITVTNNTTP